jgi:hypothetical protein
MFRKLFLALVLMVSPAFAQEQLPTVEQTYTFIQQQTVTPIQDVRDEGGTALVLLDDGVSNPINLGFDFYYYGNLYDSLYVSQNGFISFTSNANGCCSGNALPYFSGDPYYNVDNSIFAMWSDLADFQFNNPYYLSTSNSFVVGWYGVEELGTANRFTFEISLFSDNSFTINYGAFDYTMPTGRIITSGYQGDQSTEYNQIYYGNDPSSLENTTFLIQSSSIVLPPPIFLYWDRLSGENESFTLTETGVIRYGAQGVYSYQTLEAGTYECGNGLFGDPIGGVVKSCELGTNELPVAEVNCTTNPLDPSCIIDSIIDDVVDTPMLADETILPIDEEEQDTAIEEMFAADQLIEETFSEEPETLEEMLTEESTDETLDEIEETLVAKELNDEEKSSALADSIATNVLEAALAIAADAVSAAGGTAGESNVQSASSSNSASNTASMSQIEAAIEAGEVAAQSESTTTETSVVAASTESTQESSAAVAIVSDSTDSISFDSSSFDTSLDILETGRQLGQESLLATMSMTEMAAAESVSQAENVAFESSSDSLVASAATVIETAIVGVVETQEQQSIEVESSNIEVAIQDQVEQNNETLVADASAEQIQESVTVEQEQVAAETSTSQSQDIVIEVQSEEVVVAEVTNVESVSDAQDTSMVADTSQQEQQSAVEYTTIEQTMEIFAENINSQVQTEQEELEMSVVQQAIASSQTEDDNRMGFAEAEAVTIVNDPALANAFNVQPNTASLELLGVLGSAGQDKSDAELRAEQVVAANKEEQDAINANYMEADQSGILAAIGSETDVSAYRTAMLRDNNVWYKPEDIYKGVIIKDNVRGSYFLEKGNTDTYKKMIEEQYKDE